MRASTVIVGAGPSGAAAALRLAQAGARDVVIVDKDVLPRDKTCGSAISPGGLAVLDGLGVGGEVRRRGTPVRALRVVTPGGREVWLTTQEGTILPRRELDHLLVQEAQRLGVRLRDGWRASALVEEGGRVVGVRGPHGEIRADRVLIADGAHSAFSRDPRPRRTIWALMGWWEGSFATGAIEMIFDRRLSPLYGWMFPESPGRASVGICVDAFAPGAPRSDQGLRALFEGFVAEHYEGRLAGARRVGRIKGHPISHTTWIGHCGGPGVLYLGEAARMTHNLTGEGIHQALQSGVDAADAVAAMLGGAPERRALLAYTWRCRRRFTLSFAAGHALRAALKTPLCDALAGAYDALLARSLTPWAVDAALAESR